MSSTPSLRRILSNTSTAELTWYLIFYICMKGKQVYTYQQHIPEFYFFLLLSSRWGSRFTAWGVVFIRLSTLRASNSKALAMLSALRAETSVNSNLYAFARSYPYSKATFRLSIWSLLLPTISLSTPSVAYLNVVGDTYQFTGAKTWAPRRILDQSHRRR